MRRREPASRTSAPCGAARATARLVAMLALAAVLAAGATPPTAADLGAVPTTAAAAAPGVAATPAGATPAARAAPATSAVTATSAARVAPITLDGRFDDWPRDTFLVADERHVYFRLALPAVRNLQAAPSPLVIALDARAGTHFAPDLRIVFSPPSTGGQGVAVTASGGTSADAVLGHAALDLIAAPTVAARAFELRVARDVRGRPDLSAALASGPLRVQASVLRADGAPAWRGRAFQIELPPRAAAPASSVQDGARVPARGDGELRVVSWNVLLASPRKKPAPFARVLRTLAPDVLLLQEWEGATADELRTWLDANVPGEPAWSAVVGEGWGVAVAARGPLASLLAATVPRPDGAPADPRRGDAALRLVGAVATSRLGDVCAASLHLKCCGSVGSPQDDARRAEAGAANAALRAALDARGPCVRVVGGDLNLVGSRTPLDVLAAGLAGRDGGSLVAVESPVVGDRALYTWTEAWSRFSPGRLDYLLHGDGVQAVRSFALDTRRLDDDALAAAGLERKDGFASDHLPLVLDLAPRAPSDG